MVLELIGIGVGVVFILLGFTVYFFLSCTNDRLSKTEQAAENIYLNAKSGNINSGSSSPQPGTNPVPPPGPGSAPPSPGPGYYPLRRRRRRQAETAEARALAPSCFLPLLALGARSGVKAPSGALRFLISGVVRTSKLTFNSPGSKNWLME